MSAQRSPEASPPPNASPAASPTPADEDKNVVEGPIICPGHARAIPDIQFSPVFEDGSYYMLSACVDGKPMLRDGATGDWIGTFESHKGAVWCARMNKTADLMVSGSADYSAKLWDATTGEVLHTWEHKSMVRSAIFSQDASQAFTAGNDKKVFIFDVAKPESAPTELSGHSEGITYLALLPDPNLFLSIAREKDVFVWDKRTNSIARKLPTKDKSTFLSTTYDGSIAVSTSGKADVSLWNASTLELIHSVTLPRDTDCVAYDPVSKRILAGGQEEWVRSYTEAGQELSVFKGHHGPVRSLAVTPSSSAFASGSDDSTIRVWDWPKEASLA